MVYKLPHSRSHYNELEEKKVTLFSLFGILCFGF